MREDMVEVCSMVPQVCDALRVGQDGRRKEVAALFCRACGHDWHDWWDAVVGLLWESGGIPRSLTDDLNRVLDSQNPRVAAAKDIGAFTAPDRYLVKQATAALRHRGVRWPSFPSTGRLADPSGNKRACGDTVAPPDRYRRF